MKRLLLGASVCLGLFAFTTNSSSRHHAVASAGYRGLMSDTGKKDTTKPAAFIASVEYSRIISDTTKKDTTKPNLYLVSVDYRSFLSDTTKKDTTKPNVNAELAALMPK